MSELRLYQELKNAPTEDEKLQLIARAIEEARHQPSLAELPTRLELRAELSGLKSEILKGMNDQTLKMVGLIALIPVIFKLLDMAK